MKNNTFIKNFSSVLLTLMLFTVTIINPIHISALTVNYPDVKSPQTGNIFISFDGDFTTSDKASMVNRINAIRKEACNQGVINPRTGKKLKPSDYKPVTWSSSLEEYARLRAAEINVNWDHTRPNKKSTFKNNLVKLNGYHSGENIAMGYTPLSSIEAYYEEKVDWVKKTGGMTGHYENIIVPENTLVGIAGFRETNGYEYTAMEFGVSYGSNNSNKLSNPGKIRQVVEVNVSFLVKSISIKGNKNINAGSSTKLTAVANLKDEMPRANIFKGVSWSSSNPKVATVDSNGNVKGIAAGKSVIKANVNGKSANYEITVTKPKSVKVTDIKLSSSSTSVYVGSSFTLKPTITPTNATNKKVTYKSSDPKVATVDANGKVTGKAVGTATITITAADGSKKTTSIKLTVKKYIKLSSFKLNTTTLALKKGKTYQLKTTFTPTNATNKTLTWSSSNPKIATVDKNGKITAISPGVVKITAKSKDNGKSIICTVGVTK